MAQAVSTTLTSLITDIHIITFIVCYAALRFCHSVTESMLPTLSLPEASIVTAIRALNLLARYTDTLPASRLPGSALSGTDF
jgi:hypothetical protein